MNLFLLSRALLLMFSAVYGKSSQNFWIIVFSTHMKIISGRMLSYRLLVASSGILSRVLKTILDLRLYKI
jgi:hypothetical protein